MVRLRVQQLDPTTCPAALEAWHYIRPVEPVELERAKWLSYGPDVIWWLMPLEPLDQRIYALHICIAPEARRHVYGRKLTYAFEVVADILGASRLVAWIGYQEVELYLARLGWVRDTSWDEYGEGRAWVRDLGGEPWVAADRASRRRRRRRTKRRPTQPSASAPAVG